MVLVVGLADLEDRSMHQAAALPFRRVDGAACVIEILLVTSSSSRWIIPKGEIDHGMAPHLAAAKEAFEEGGVRGRSEDRSIGSFAIRKEQCGAIIPLEVDVFPMKVDEELASWPEMDFRERRWLPLEEAAAKVDDQGLAAIIASFRP